MKSLPFSISLSSDCLIGLQLRVFCKDSIEGEVSSVFIAISVKC